MQIVFVSLVSALALHFTAATTSLDDPKYVGFDCGRSFFSNHDIKRNVAIIAGKISQSSPSRIGIPPTDQLGSINWPLLMNAEISETAQVSSPSATFYIVVDHSGEFKDVKAKITNGDLVRCSQVLAIRKKLRKSPGNGYQCGNVFFDDVKLKMEATNARSGTDPKISWPKPYKGNLYRDGVCFAWPLSVEGSSTTPNDDSPYQLLFTKGGKILNVVAKISVDEYIKCERKFNPLHKRPAGAPSLISRLELWKFHTSSTYRELRRRFNLFESDHSCDKRIYTKKQIMSAKRNALEAKDQSSGYSTLYQDYPCPGSQSCMRWPIPTTENDLSEIPSEPVDFVLLSQEFKILGAATHTNNQWKTCNIIAKSTRISGSKRIEIEGTAT